jgi:Tfp pilus assembly protein PilO
MLILKSVWAFVKTYWSYITAGIAAIAALIGIIVMSRPSQQFSGEFKKINKAHDEELEKVEEAYKQEAVEHKINAEKLQNDLVAIETKHATAEKQLEVKTQKEVERIVVDYKDDMKGLADKLSKATGIKVVE